MEYPLQNRQKLAENEPKWLKYNVPLDPRNSPRCLSTRMERLFGTARYVAEIHLTIVRIYHILSNSAVYMYRRSYSRLIVEGVYCSTIAVHCEKKI